MNLQPIYPAKPEFNYFCHRCGKRGWSSSGYADLDAAPGTYVCAECAGKAWREEREQHPAPACPSGGTGPAY